MLAGLGQHMSPGVTVIVCPFSDGHGHVQVQLHKHVHALHVVCGTCTPQSSSGAVRVLPVRAPGCWVAVLPAWGLVLIPLLLPPVPAAAGPPHSLQHHHQLHGHQGGR